VIQLRQKSEFDAIASLDYLAKADIGRLHRHVRDGPSAELGEQAARALPYLVCFWRDRSASMANSQSTLPSVAASSDSRVSVEISV
jgi:hypothetical protein